MSLDPLRLRLGTSNGYLVRAREGYVLVDAGVPGMAGRFRAQLRRHGIAPSEIRLVVVTHVHYDHVGSLSQISQLTRAPVAVHQIEEDLLASGRVVVPPGLNLYGSLASLAGSILAPFARLAPHQAEIVVKDELPLADFGLEGALVHTPGHTGGSVTLLPEDGNAVVGDLCSNTFRFGRVPLSPFGDSVTIVHKSWRLLLDRGAKRILPGHGPPFGSDLLRARLGDG